ncbi:MAG: SynChlorMet cassette protein ScmC [Candidatus Poribacteria bacterium]
MRLANGHGWYITATEESRTWVDRLANIMELETCEVSEYPKLIFVRGNSSKNHAEETLCNDALSIKQFSMNGWELHDLGATRFWIHHDVPDVICEIGYKKDCKYDCDYEYDIVKMLQSLYPIYQRELNSGGLPLHAGLIERKDKGILLAAPGGTGKSTCCRRIPPPWHPLCDDETLIVFDGMGQYIVHPFPTWSERIQKRSERTWDIQQHIPLSAIFFLEQAKNDEVISIGQGQAAILINQMANQVCYRNWKNLDLEKQALFRKELFSNSCELAKKIPAFILRVSLSGQFWEEIESVLIMS